jgi:hypothetical protein
MLFPIWHEGREAGAARASLHTHRAPDAKRALCFRAGRKETGAAGEACLAAESRV